jgi:hypothetical protein
MGQASPLPLRGLLGAERDDGAVTLRLGVAAALLACLVGSSAGLAWDIDWHQFVGRDSFLTPPHAVLYGGVAAAGVVALAGVLLESWRSWPGATSLWAVVLRVPLGLFVTGSGILALMASAPLDNYWHELYGLDVTLWAPFHVMGLVGGVLVVMGAVYLFAAELARRRRLGLGGQAVILAALLFSLSAILRGLQTIFHPALGFATTVLGPVEVLTMPVCLAFSVALASRRAGPSSSPWKCSCPWPRCSRPRASMPPTASPGTASCPAPWRRSRRRPWGRGWSPRRDRSPPARSRWA